MRLKVKILFVILLLSNILYAQNSIKLTAKYGSDYTEVQHLTDFENIFIEQLNFESQILKGKSYVINMIEFKNGEKIKTTTLFDGTELDYFKINSDKLVLDFYFKLENGKLKTQLFNPQFKSRKSYFKLYDETDKYVLKDFLGRKSEIMLDMNKKHTILAIITPKKNADGSSSYCEVVQSNIKPEELGNHFQIPHYFLVNIEFK